MTAAIHARNEVDRWITLVLFLALFEIDIANAQTLPLNSNDALYTYIDADRWTMCGVTKTGYIRCRGDLATAPLRSETADYVDVTVSRHFTCGRKTNGSVRCWTVATSFLPAIPDFDPDGTPGNGDERAYTFSDIHATQQHGCGLTDGNNGQTSGKIICWGLGSVRPGSDEDRLSTIPDASSTLSLIPAASGGDVDFTSLSFSHLASGNRSNCALISSSDTNNSKPRCWSVYGSAGNAGDSEPDVPLTAISIGNEDPACGIVKQDTTVGSKTYTAEQIVCWGLDASRIVSTAPTTGTYSDVAVGHQHACAVRTDSKITCWGLGSTTTGADYGQLTVPSDLSSATFSTVHAGTTFTCGLLDGSGTQIAGTLHCWGDTNHATVHPNDPGLHAIGLTVPYSARPDIPQLFTGSDTMDVNWRSSCALTAMGHAACWGHPSYGWPPPQGVKGIAAGFGGFCFLKNDGMVTCRGSNFRGMNSGASTSSTAMTADLGTLRFSLIFAGIQHYCGLIFDTDSSDGNDTGKVRCWGLNDRDQAVATGQTAAVNAGSSQSKTITNLGTNTYNKITAGYRYSCGLLTTGRITCWGNQNSPASTAHQIPADLQSKTFSDIDAGWWHQTCAIEAAGTNQTAGKLYCWGNDLTIGGVTVPLGSVPSELQNLTFKKVSAGRDHNCAITVAGHAKCWGDGSYGRTTVPAKYQSTVFVDIDAGRTHTCGVTDQGGAACWGADGDLNTQGIQIAQPNGVLVNFGQADPQPPAGGGTRSRTILVDPPSPPVVTPVPIEFTVELKGDYGTVNEGDRVAIVVTLSKPPGRHVAIPLKVSLGTAEPSDVSPAPVVDIWGGIAGRRTAIGHIWSYRDHDTDDDTFTVSFGDLPPGIAAGDRQHWGVKIRDTCGNPADQVLRVSDASAHEPESLYHPQYLHFEVTLDAVSEHEVGVDYSTREGTAREWWDYEEDVRGRLKFHPGETSKTVRVNTSDDASAEGCETMYLDLAHPLCAVIADGEGVGYIHDDPPASASAWMLPQAAQTVWMFPSASDRLRRGVVLVRNLSEVGGVVMVTATDDAGVTYAPLTLALNEYDEVRFDSNDLESGNSGLGLSGSTGAGVGNWRLQFTSDELDIAVEAYVHAADSFVAAMNATVPLDDEGALRVPLFNGADEPDGRSHLRLVNPGKTNTQVKVVGVDDRGRSSGEPVLLTISAESACTVDAAQLESGTSLACGLAQRGLGDGTGRWRLKIVSDAPIVAMNLLEARDGRLSNLSDVLVAEQNGVRKVPAFPSVVDAGKNQGMIRLENRAQVGGALLVQAFDEVGKVHSMLTLHVDPGEAVDLSADDLELGNKAKGLLGSIGAGRGSWHLVLSGDVAFDASTYVLGVDGFLSALATPANSPTVAHADSITRSVGATQTVRTCNDPD